MRLCCKHPHSSPKRIVLRDDRDGWVNDTWRAAMGFADNFARGVWYEEDVSHAEKTVDDDP